MVIVFSRENAGANFLDWSLHWLTAQENHYSCSGVISSVTDDPVGNGVNAHGHPRNRSWLKKNLTFDHQYGLLSSLQTTTGLRVLHLFGEPNPEEEVLKLEQCGRRGDRLIVVTSNYDFWRDISRAMPPEYYDFDYYRKWIMDLWHGLDESKIRTPGLVREFLCFHCRDILGHLPVGDILSDHFRCSKDDLIRDGESVLRNCIGWLGLSVDESRMPQWRMVASRWRGMIAVAERYKHNWSKIVESVIVGSDFECGGLTLAQEAALMYDVLVATKGRMIRARSLERLPANAKDIHLLIC